MLACDHKSVGVLVFRNGRLLLIERRKPPFGLAPPAGHVDNRPDFEAAARSELQEEVGLVATELELIAQGRKNNHCRRPGGTWHFWKIYRASAVGEIHRSLDETKSFLWCEQQRLDVLAARTDRFEAGVVPSAEWKREPGLEPVWKEWLAEVRQIRSDLWRK